VIARQPDDPTEGAPIGRRAFLGLVAVGASSLVWGDAASRLLSQAARPVTDALPATLRDVIPAPGGGWRIYAVNPPLPTFNPARWQLRIDGLVERPRRLSYSELRALPAARQVSDFHCVTGWSVAGVHWAGVRFADLLALVRPLSSAKTLVFFSAERPYVDTLTLEQGLSADAMLAYDMDGRPLTRPHGAPARLVMPRMYGYKGVKWVERILVSDRTVDGFWEQRGYDRDAWLGHSNGLA
jgi:DMSO/TMAO reductase YedYZ molybdopterin-dependent catalytic subunit